MGAVTYPDPAVQAELAQHFVPVQLESAKAPELARRFNVRWLPGLVTCDADERPATLQTAFLPPEDLVPELRFARGLMAMGAKRYDEAHALFEDVGARADQERAPEAMFWWGVSRYRQSKDFEACQDRWRELIDRFPTSPWRRKVEYAVTSG